MERTDNLSIEQAAWGGLTCIHTIREAFVSHPDFEWEWIGQKIGTQWEAAKTALNIVKTNKYYKYYGFAQNLGPVAFTHYKMIAYVAKELLVRVDGQQALNGYAGLE